MRKRESGVKASRALTPHALLGRLALPLLILLTLSISIPATALGQGCAQCLDSTRATPPAVQAAYRHAILLMAGVASSLFVTGTLLLRKMR